MMAPHSMLTRITRPALWVSLVFAALTVLPSDGEAQFRGGFSGGGYGRAGFGGGLGRGGGGFGHGAGLGPRGGYGEDLELGRVGGGRFGDGHSGPPQHGGMGRWLRSRPFYPASPGRYGPPRPRPDIDILVRPPRYEPEDKAVVVRPRPWRKPEIEIAEPPPKRRPSRYDPPDVAEPPQRIRPVIERPDVVVADPVRPVRARPEQPEPVKPDKPKIQVAERKPEPKPKSPRRENAEPAPRQVVKDRPKPHYKPVKRPLAERIPVPKLAKQPEPVRLVKEAEPAKAAKPPPPPLARPPAEPSRPIASAPLPEEPDIVPGEVLFELKPGAPESAIVAIVRRERLERISTERFSLVPISLHRYHIRDQRSVAEVVEALRRDPRIGAAQPNHVFKLVGETPGRPFASAQYAIAKLNLRDAHRAATGRGVPVAVIDSGIDAAHPALKGALTQSFDAIEGRAAAAAPHAHGTAIAGIIGSRAQLASAAPDAPLLAARAFSGAAEARPSGAQGTTIHVLRAIDWTATAKARVVNMSFAGPADAKLSQFLAAGTAQGTIYVAAAGNAGPEAKPLHPAADENALAVTATDADDKIFARANRGRHICLSAPGVDVLVAAPGGTYGLSSGTSMAAAQVSGIVALMLQANPGLTPYGVRAALTKSARDLGPPGADESFGSGFADARHALHLIGASLAAPLAVGPSEGRPTPAAGPRALASENAASASPDSLPSATGSSGAPGFRPAVREPDAPVASASTAEETDLASK